MSVVAQQRRAVPLGLAAQIEVLLRHERAAAIVRPGFPTLELAPVHHPFEVERAAVLGQTHALLDEDDAQAGARQLVRGGASAGAGPDDQRVMHYGGVHRTNSEVSQSASPTGGGV